MNYKSIFEYVIDLISRHGKYEEFIELYFVILSSVDDLKANPEIPKCLLENLINHSTFDKIDPFFDTLD
jgi:hypothetical protein